MPLPFKCWFPVRGETLKDAKDIPWEDYGVRHPWDAAEEMAKRNYTGELPWAEWSVTVAVQLPVGYVAWASVKVPPLTEPMVKLYRVEVKAIPQFEALEIVMGSGSN